MESILSGYLEEKNRIKTLITELTSYIHDIHVKSEIKKKYSTEIKEIEQQFTGSLNGTYPVAVLAGWNNGKSTFLNAMLGKDLLPMKNKSYTSTITRIRYADRPKLTISYLNGELEEIELDDINFRDLEHYVTVDSEDDSKIKEVIVDYPFEACRGGIEFIDTPGVNSINETHDEITQTVIPNVKTMIILVRANYAGGKEDVEFFKKVLKDRNQDEFSTFFIINKCDNMSIEEVEDAKETLQRALALVVDDNGKPLSKNPRILTTSAYFELKCALYQNRIIDFIDIIDDEKLYYEDHGTHQHVSNPEDIDRVREIANFSMIKQQLNDDFRTFRSTESSFNQSYRRISQLLDQIEEYLTNVQSFLKSNKPIEEFERNVQNKDAEMKKFEQEINRLKMELKERATDKINRLSGSSLIRQQTDRCLERINKKIDAMDVGFSHKEFVSGVLKAIEHEVFLGQEKIHLEGTDAKRILSAPYQKGYDALFQKHAPSFKGDVNTLDNTIQLDTVYYAFLMDSLGEGIKGKLHRIIANLFPSDYLQVKIKMKEKVKRCIAQPIEEICNRCYIEQGYSIASVLREQSDFQMDMLLRDSELKQNQLEQEYEKRCEQKRQKVENTNIILGKVSGYLTTIKEMKQQIEKGRM